MIFKNNLPTLQPSNNHFKPYFLFLSHTFFLFIFWNVWETMTLYVSYWLKQLSHDSKMFLSFHSYTSIINYRSCIVFSLMNLLENVKYHFLSTIQHTANSMGGSGLDQGLHQRVPSFSTTRYQHHLYWNKRLSTWVFKFSWYCLWSQM